MDGVVIDCLFDIKEGNLPPRISNLSLEAEVERQLGEYQTGAILRY